MLISRIITASILLPLVVLCVWYLPPFGFIAIALTIVALAGWEMSAFFWPKNTVLRCVFLFSLLLLCILSILGPWLLTLVVLSLGALWWFCVPYLLSHYVETDKFHPVNGALAFLIGFLTFVPFFSGLIVLRFDYGAEYVLFLLAIVCGADIGAYFGGMFWGRHKLVKKISPKKTIEGLIGGVALSLLIATIIGLILHLKWIAWLLWLFFIVVVVLWSVIGDLFESMLKRVANVKDSGHILPGHGGMYDRIDSLTAAVPVFTLGLAMLGL